MKGYKVEIVSCSKELSAKEKVMMKDTSDALSLDKEADSETGYIIEPDIYVELKVHNENSENQDYKVYLIVDKSGVKYTTSSEAFWSTFIEIVSEMEGCEEDWAIKVYKKDSKRYTGKQFITCSVI